MVPKRKRMWRASWLCWVGVLFLWCSVALAQTRPPECEPPDVLLIVDNSGSMDFPMVGNSGVKKVTVMRQAYSEILTKYDKRIRFGLLTFRSFPPPSQQSCGNVSVQLDVPIGPNNATRCAQVLNTKQVGGCTPMYPALQEANKHYVSAIPKDTLKKRRRYVVLMTDGVPNVGCPGYTGARWRGYASCGRYLVDEVQKLRGLQIGGQVYDVKTYVIGFGSLYYKNTRSLDPQNLNDMAQAGGTGKYFQASNLTQLRQALEAIANSAAGKKEICNNKDDDCDGQTDEGLIETCQGACGSGKKVCYKGNWGACSALPKKEKKSATEKTTIATESPTKIFGRIAPSSTNAEKPSGLAV